MTDDATDWRDIAEQLSPQQIGEVVKQRDDITPETMLSAARDMAAGNLADAVVCLPEPADAVTTDAWENDGSGRWSRRPRRWLRLPGEPIHSQLRRFLDSAL